MTIAYGIISFIVVIISLSVHEYAHAASAQYFGDPTARSMGRLTLNPIAHIDPIGTIILPLFLAITGMSMFGWAKPVPVNPLNLRNMRRDLCLVSAAGPFANLTLAILSAVMIRVILIVFPNDSSSGAINFTLSILVLMVIINTLLMLFNLLPIPPLDGAAVLDYFLPSKAAYKFRKIQRYGFMILILLIWSGLLYSLYLQPLMGMILSLLSGVAGLSFL